MDGPGMQAMMGMTAALVVAAAIMGRLLRAAARGARAGRAGTGPGEPPLTAWEAQVARDVARHATRLVSAAAAHGVPREEVLAALAGQMPRLTAAQREVVLRAVGLPGRGRPRRFRHT